MRERGPVVRRSLSNAESHESWTKAKLVLLMGESGTQDTQGAPRILIGIAEWQTSEIYNTPDIRELVRDDKEAKAFQCYCYCNLTVSGLAQYYWAGDRLSFPTCFRYI